MSIDSSIGIRYCREILFNPSFFVQSPTFDKFQIIAELQFTNYIKKHKTPKSLARGYKCQLIYYRLFTDVSSKAVFFIICSHQPYYLFFNFIHIDNLSYHEEKKKRRKKLEKIGKKREKREKREKKISFYKSFKAPFP
jgi:hypothetical protein